MVYPMLSLEHLAALKLPDLRTGGVDLHELRRGSAAVSVGWIERMRTSAEVGAPLTKEWRADETAGAKLVRLGPFEFSVAPERVAVRLDGTDRWVIETGTFTGTSLSTTVQNGVVDIVLSDAL